MDLNISGTDLSLENAAFWPMPIKIFFAIILFCIIVFLGYWSDTKAQLAELSMLKSEQKSLLKSVSEKQQQAAKLMAYRNQLTQADKVFEKVLQHLPKRSEMPDLLEEISRTGLASGLSFALFRPEPEIKKGFYSELPIQISVIGTYHQLGQFISELAGLDRVVTLHDFTIMPVTNGHEKTSEEEILHGELILNIKAQTYRYERETPSDVIGNKEE